MIAPWSGDHVCPWHLSHLEYGFCVVYSLCIVYVVLWCVYVCVVCVYIYKEHEYELLCLCIWENVCGMFVTGHMGCSEGIYPVLHACSRQWGHFPSPGIPETKWRLDFHHAPVLAPSLGFMSRIRASRKWRLPSLSDVKISSLSGCGSHPICLHNVVHLFIMYTFKNLFETANNRNWHNKIAPNHERRQMPGKFGVWECSLSQN